MAGPPPRYGTSSTSSLVASRTTSKTSSDTDVTPADALVSFLAPGACDNSINFFMVLAGTKLLTQTASGALATKATGSNSAVGSNVGLISLKPGRMTMAFSDINSV